MTKLTNAPFLVVNGNEPDARVIGDVLGTPRVRKLSAGRKEQAQCIARRVIHSRQLVPNVSMSIYTSRQTFVRSISITCMATNLFFFNNCDSMYWLYQALEQPPSPRPL